MPVDGDKVVRPVHKKRKEIRKPSAGTVMKNSRPAELKIAGRKTSLFLTEPGAGKI